MDPNDTGIVGYNSFLNVFNIKDLIIESTKSELRAAFRVFDRYKKSLDIFYNSIKH